MDAINSNPNPNELPFLFHHYNLGIQYYPKLLIAIPFTPATGSRMIFAPHLHPPKNTEDGVSSTVNEEKRHTIMKSVATAARALTHSNKV